LLLDLDRQLGLAELAAAGLLGGGAYLGRGLRAVAQRHPDELHGEGGGALLDPAGAGVGHERPGDAGGVHPVVLVEAGVLAGHDGLLHVRADVGDRDELAVLLVERGQQGLPVAGVDVGGLRRPDRGELGGQVLQPAGAGPQSERADRGDGEERDGQQHTGDQAGAQEHRCLAGYGEYTRQHAAKYTINPAIGCLETASCFAVGPVSTPQ
jgi:hypothetical protein